MINLLSASDVDRTLHLRKGTAMSAYRAGKLRGVRRRGRGGWQVWVLEEDAKTYWLTLSQN